MTHRKHNPQLIDEAMAHFTIGDMLERNLEKNPPSQVNGHESRERPPMDDHDKQQDYENFLQDVFSDLVSAGADPEMLQNLMDTAVLHAMHAGRRASVQNTGIMFKVMGT